MLESNETERIVFHFNKKYLEDNTIPMWVVKHKGETYYVNHMTVNVGFSTKETPEGRTKGSLLIKGKLKIYEENGQILAEVN